jgi:large subunit ribosomal protein L21
MDGLKQMFAVIRTGGKQYMVSKDDTLHVAKIEGNAGDKVALDDVLFGADGKKATVSAEIVKHIRTRKILIFKKIKRQNHRRKNGHRQDLTVIKITDVKAA